MKSRLMKKRIKQLTWKELCETVAYTENKVERYHAEKEFDKRKEMIFNQEPTDGWDKIEHYV